MKKEQKVIDFDSMGYEAAISSIEMFAKSINQKPYEGNDPLSLRDFHRNGIVNESFGSCCLKLGISPSAELLKEVLNKNPEQLTVIIIDEIMAALDKQNLHPAIKNGILKDYEPAIAEFVNVLLRLTQSYHNLNRPTTSISKRLYQLENYLSFIDGQATIAEKTENDIREEFTTRVDSEARQEAFDGLKGIADAINQFNANVTKRGTNLKLMSPDPYYFNLEGDFVTPDNSNIKYF